MTSFVVASPDALTTACSDVGLNGGGHGGTVGVGGVGGAATDGSNGQA
jgi:hypothetical protein